MCFILCKACRNFARDIDSSEICPHRKNVIVFTTVKSALVAWKG